MSVPDYESLMLPLLRAIQDGAEHPLRELREKLATELQLTEIDRRELLPSGKQPVFANRLGWAKTYLEKAGLLRSTRRAVYQLTDPGKQLLATNPASIDRSTLERYPTYLAFAGRDGPRDVDDGEALEPAPIADDSKATPQERLESAYRQLRRQTEREVLELTMKSSPTFFEHLVVKLLVAMGYGGSVEDAGQALGRSGDGGIDGLIKEDVLGLDAVYVQAKRWQNTVGRPEIQAFAGSLEGERARKGVFITTSTFSKEAREYVKRIDKRIVLIDGDRLAALMFDHGVGLSAVTTFEVKQVDHDFFEEE